MAEVAREVIVMVESDKVGRKIPNLELPRAACTPLLLTNACPQRHANKFKPAAST